MALKKTRQEVKHIIVTGNMDNLNRMLSDFLNEKWEIKLVEKIHIDFNNQQYVFLYVLTRDNDAE